MLEIRDRYQYRLPQKTGKKIFIADFFFSSTFLLLLCSGLLMKLAVNTHTSCSSLPRRVCVFMQQRSSCWEFSKVCALWVSGLWNTEVIYMRTKTSLCKGGESLGTRITLKNSDSDSEGIGELLRDHPESYILSHPSLHLCGLPRKRQ